jgi:hypothetical protein
VPLRRRLGAQLQGGAERQVQVDVQGVDLLNTDIRLNIEFLDHSKTRRMLRALGPWGPLSLLRLWMYAAKNRPDGVLEGMSSEDIEDSAGWLSVQADRPGEFFHYLTRNRWLDKAGRGVWKLHEWALWQPWVAEAEDRERDGRRGAHVRYHVQKGVSKPRVCEFCREAIGGLEGDDTDGIAPTRGGTAPAPSPKPIPSPEPIPVTAKERDGAGAAANRAREAKAKRIAEWCRKNDALCCLTCSHEMHRPWRCTECDDCDSSSATLRPSLQGAFEAEFQMPWNAWTEQRAEMETL